MAGALVLLAAVALPMAIGVACAYLSRPWWWGAIVAIALAVVLLVAPEPEEGESRVDGGDLLFLVIVAAVVAGLVWFGAWTARRLRGASS